MTTGIILIVVAILLAFYVYKSIKTIQAGEFATRKNFGKLEKDALEPGLHFEFKPIQKIKVYNSTIQPIDWESVIILSGKGDPTSDDPLERSMDVEVDLDIRYKIINPVNLESNIGLGDMLSAIQTETLTILTDTITTQSLRKSINEWINIRDNIKTRLEKLIKSGEHWGVKIIQINRRKLEPKDPDVHKALNKVAEAESERKQKIIEADRDLKVAKKKADAEAYKISKEASAKVKEIERIAKAHGIEKNSEKYFALMRYLDTLKVMGSSESSMVVPTELSGIAGLVSAILKTEKGKGGKK